MGQLVNGVWTKGSVSNNQKDGIKSYNYVVDLLIGYYKKTGYKNN